MPHDPARLTDVCAWLDRAAADMRAAHHGMTAETPLISDVLSYRQPVVEQSFEDPTFQRTRMDDQIEVLKLVTSRLESAGIDYMVTGSLALSSYAQPRMTLDIALVVAVQPDDAQLLKELFGDEFECDVEGIRAAISRQGLFNLIHTARVVKVDFIVRKLTRFRREEFSRRRRLDLAGQQIWMTSPEDLLLSKLLWAKNTRSPVQLSDAASLIDSTTLDWDYTQQGGGAQCQ
jgi:hypothetical protein